MLEKSQVHTKMMLAHTTRCLESVVVNDKKNDKDTSLATNTVIWSISSLMYLA